MWTNIAGDGARLNGPLSYALSRYGWMLVLALAGLIVVVLAELAHALGLRLKDDVAPIVTAAGVTAAVLLFYLKEASDRRRKTLEAVEKQLYDKDLRSAISTVVTALQNGTYEVDAAADRVGSDRDLTSFIINYVEFCCQGVENKLYDRRLVQDLLRPLATLLITRFLIQPVGRKLPTTRFLDSLARLDNMQATFAAEFRAVRPQRVLVIRLGALGDFMLSFAAFAAIRAHHVAGRITLLTTAPFADIARASPWFDEVVIDARPSWWDAAGVLRLSRQLRGYDRVYDLQTSARSSRYFHLAGWPRWSGIALGAALRHANPARDAMHTLERQREQLALAGIAAFPQPDLSWLQGAVFEIAAPFALLAPGAAPHRPRKRWPARQFGELAALLHARGLTPVVIGSAAEAPLAAIIAAACPNAIDLTGRTTLADIAAVARRAALAVGNDTGPMHLAAAVGCHCIVLFSADSDPALTAPRGPGGAWPIVLRSDDLADLTVARVAGALP